MYDENQLITIRWSTSNREWYKSLGYKYTKCKDPFTVKAKHLTPHSSSKINVKCDYCGANYLSQYDLILKGRKKYSKGLLFPLHGKEIV